MLCYSWSMPMPQYGHMPMAASSSSVQRHHTYSKWKKAIYLCHSSRLWSNVQNICAGVTAKALNTHLLPWIRSCRTLPSTAHSDYKRCSHFRQFKLLLFLSKPYDHTCGAQLAWFLSWLGIHIPVDSTLWSNKHSQAKKNKLAGVCECFL